MEKILLVINAYKPHLASIHFACAVAQSTKTKLTGLFIENVYFGYVPSDFDEPSSSDRSGKAGAEATADSVTVQAIQLFVSECAKKGVEQEIYINKGEPIQEIIYESRFADLLILDPGIDFYNDNEQLPSHLVKEVLTNAECPVILTPEKTEALDEIVFCYDGSASSVFAIKQFTYLLAPFTTKRAVLLEISKSAGKEGDSQQKMLSWLGAHYLSVSHVLLEGDAQDELFAYLFKKQNKWVVLGAYGRGLLSRFFRKSSADILIRSVDLPLFITHY
jgi:hypothetical protein